MKAKQTRRVCGITYLTADDLLKLFSQKSNIIKNFAFIEHNKDVYEEDNEAKNQKKGDLKQTHIHFIILFNFPYNLTTVQNWFLGWVDENDKSINTFVEVCTDIHSYYRYFMHLDHPTKFQYSESDIVSGDLSDFQIEDDSCEDSAYIALELMLNGVPIEQIAKRLGRDFIYHYHHIKLLYNDIMSYRTNS